MSLPMISFTVNRKTKRKTLIFTWVGKKDTSSYRRQESAVVFDATRRCIMKLDSHLFICYTWKSQIDKDGWSFTHFNII